MRIFLCAGEPSGDLHGANLVQALHQLRPDIECVGYGGDRMAAAGCHLHYPLSQLAVMGFVRIFAGMTTFLDLLGRADRYFARHRPDAVVLIDYPGFNWWMARRAHHHGIPVFYFVPPQLWGWGGWRVRKMQRWVDHVLCTLPFEAPWYHERGVDAHYVGHPYFDELPRQQLDAAFLARQQAQGGTLLGLLPGSRTQEVEHNLPTLLRAAAHIHAARPETRFLVACFKPAHACYVEARVGGLPFVEVCTQRTPEIIHLAQACVAVSGSVGLELLYQGKPSVVVYRVSRWELRLSEYFRTAPYISLVNLLANEELFPEFLTDHCEAQAVGERVLHWLRDPAAYAALTGRLAALRERVAEPGACARAAAYLLQALGQAPARQAA